MLALLPFFAAWSDDLATARAALQDHLYPVAQTHAEMALEKSFSNDAFLILIEALAGQKYPDQVLQQLDAHTNLVSQASQPEAFAYWRSWALLEQGHAQAAIQAAQIPDRAIGPYADALRRSSARAHLTVGDMKGALAYYTLIDRSSTNLKTRAANALEWALVLEQAGQINEAIDVLKRQSELNIIAATISEGAFLRGRLLFQQGNTDEATRIFTQLAMNERAPERARVQALVQMSEYTMRANQTNEAIAYARSAYERASQPETRRLAGFRLGDLLATDAKTIDEGEKIIRSLVREFPEHPQTMEAHLKLADALLRLNRPERAADEYRIFLETYPPSSLNAAVLQGRGWALMRLGRYAEAGGMFQRAAEAVTSDTEKAECLFKQGDALLADTRFAEAAKIYADLAQRFPKSKLAARAFYQSAECLERAGQDQEAATQYRRVAETFPEQPEAPNALLRYAALQIVGGVYEDAIKTYTDLIGTYAQSSVRANALMGRGRTYYRMYRFDAAMQDFAAVAESTPTRRDEARFLLTQCLYGLGRDKEARASGAAFLLEFPESPRLPDMILWLGKCDFNSGAFEDARRFFLDYVTRWPTGHWADAALLWAARAAEGAADFTGAVELITRLVRTYPESLRLTEAHLVQGNALMELARFEEAILLFDQVISKVPKTEASHQALLCKADCLFALGAGHEIRYQEALTAYRTLLDYEGISPGLTLQLQFKIARCLEKLKRIDEAIDTYYAHVMIRYQTERTQGVWFDETGDSLFVRAAFSLAELYEQKGQPEQAIQVLERVRQSGVPGSSEVQQRIERLRKKKTGGL